MLTTLKEWDSELFIWMNNLGVDSWDYFWVFATQAENWFPLYILFFTLIYYFNSGKRGLLLCLCLLVTFFVTITFTELVKEFFERLRPNNVIELSSQIRVLQSPTNYSFFSGHASSSFSIVTFVVLVIKHHSRWIYLAYLWPILFVLSRVFVGVHYPSDILVGAAVGVLIAWLIYKVTYYFLGRFDLLDSTDGETVSNG